MLVKDSGVILFFIIYGLTLIFNTAIYIEYFGSVCMGYKFFFLKLNINAHACLDSHHFIWIASVILYVTHLYLE